MKTIFTQYTRLFAMVIAMGLMAPAAWADGTVTYTGQGFNFDGTTYNLNDERCGKEGQGTANDSHSS